MGAAADSSRGAPAPAERGEPRRGRGLPATARDVLLWSAATLLLFALFPRIPGPGPIEVDALLGFALGLPPVVMLTWVTACRRASPRVLGIVVVAGAAAAVALSAAGWLVLAVPCKVVFAAGAGRLLGRQVGEPLWLAAIAVVAVAADIWSVFAGPTKAVVERAPGFLDYLLVHFPLLGRVGGGMGLGLSDVIFLALFAAGSAQAGLRPRAGVVAMASSLLATVAVALMWKPALPALPFLSLAFLAVNADLLVAAVPRRRAG